MRRIVTLCLAIGITACAPTMVQMSLEPADVDAAKALLGPGTSTIKGSALLRQQGGAIVTCAGNDVFLVPATASAVSELRRVFGDDKGYVPRGGGTYIGGGKLVVPPEPNRPGMCNAQGFFSFTNVRAGKWYVLTNVTWLSNDMNQGGTLLGTVEIAEGQEKEIVLTQ